MLKDSIQEMLDASVLCIDFKKENGGCLGYPATVLLMSIIDTIGSYYEGNKNYKINIDGKEKIINSGSFQHFYILNSEYYNLGLSEDFIKRIYDNFRSLLTHNAVIAKNHLIVIDDPLERPFCDNDGFKDEKTGEAYPSIALIPLLLYTKFAVKLFVDRIDSVFPESKQANLINKKK